MELELEGKRVLITGGSRGIGLASAIAFAREGAEVTIVGSRADTVEKARDHLHTLGLEVEVLIAKLDEPAALESLSEHLERSDILINNAGAIPGGGLELDETVWRSAWDLKVHGYINATRYALSAMEQRRAGVVVNVIGIAGATPRYDYLCGSVGNAALIAFTQAVGAHSAKHGVRVLGLNPGPTQTDRVETLYKARAQQAFGDASRWRELLSDLPFGRLTEAHEIADIVVFLASARASYLSGVVIDADGGARYANH
ncbi:short-chain dehydrogenase/reductase [Pseudomonas putida]|uniref:SDR family NAD(P)-dependent oxidoreductase n=1 Tax=Pseudomonas putida TaxID=303 RepID=A0A8I1EH08_PSEPU|nr:short-chain dehydrogenase/reductase [Pseudomonas putida]MBI6885013.1 SDR family NAD(P)-dependent oxidoreductase [Pseudomonas putida]